MKAEVQASQGSLQLQWLWLLILVLVSPALITGCASDPEWSEAAKRPWNISASG